MGVFNDCRAFFCCFLMIAGHFFDCWAFLIVTGRFLSVWALLHCGSFYVWVCILIHGRNHSCVFPFWGLRFCHCYGAYLYTIILGVLYTTAFLVSVKWVVVMPVLILYLKRCSRLRIVVFTINAIRQINMVITECQFSFFIKML
jgi:hypothetical protein